MEVGVPDELSFRPGKRRKFLRRRARDGNEEAETTSEVPTAPPHSDSSLLEGMDTRPDQLDGSESHKLSLAEILRLRKANKNRKGGIEFSNVQSKTRNGGDDTSGASDALIHQDPEEERIKAISDRFIPHSGQIVDVDKHMMAYIESEMAKRRQGNTLSNLPSSDNAMSDDPDHIAVIDKLPQRQPASLGKLHEIDLGPDATRRNMERTEAAARRMNGEDVMVEEETNGKKVRLGKNGKPWRGRRRRNSEDVKRDKLVEEVLRESKLEIYDEPDQEQDDDNLAADDRIAEQFRRDFMDAIQSRRTRGGQPKPATKVGKVEAPKGPKLGGSRSARAAMREQQEKAAKK